MTFAADLKRFTVLVAHRNREVLFGVATTAKDSVVEGSALTGAPGQPVDTGYLRNSWQLVFAPDMQSATIGTIASYAPVIEYGLKSAFDPKGQTGRFGVLGGSIGPALAGGRSRQGPRGFGVLGGRVGPSLPTGDRINIRSLVGGVGSVRLTVANADAIQREVVERVTR